MAKVSVVIPCYRHAGYLTGAVRSVVTQTHADWEIVIVNDGSDDNSDLVIESLVAAYPEHAILGVSQDHQGLSAARNAGIEASRGHYILPLDADDRLAPTMLEQTVALLEGCRDLAIAYTDGMAFAPDRELTYLPMSEWDPDLLRHRNCLPPCSLYRRHVWNDVGGYHVSMPSYEDWDFWLGCAEHGMAAGHVPVPLFGYRVSETGLHAQGLRRDLELRARIVCNHPKLFGKATFCWATAIVEGTGDADEHVPEEILARDNAIRALAASRDALVRKQRKRSRRHLAHVAGERRPTWLRS